MEATLLGTLLPEISKTLTPGQSGSIAAIQSFGLILASLVTGPVLDRAGRKVGALTGLSLVIVSLVLLPGSTDYLRLLLVIGLLGVGGGVISTSTNTLASDLGGSKPAGVMNLLNVFFGLGGLATPALGSFLETRTLCGLIVVLAVMTMGLHISSPPSHRIETAATEHGNFRELLLRPLFLLLCLFLFLYVAAEVGIWNWYAVWLTGRGVPKADALRVLSFGFAAGIIVGRITAARLLQRIRATAVTLICSVLIVIMTLLMLRATSAMTAGMAVFCAGLAMAPIYPTTLSLVGQAFRRGTATAIGIAVTLGWVGVAVSSKLIGLLAGDQPSKLTAALLVIPTFAGLMVIVSLLIARLHRNA